MEGRGTENEQSYIPAQSILSAPLAVKWWMFKILAYKNVSLDLLYHPSYDVNGLLKYPVYPTIFRCDL